MEHDTGQKTKKPKTKNTLKPLTKWFFTEPNIGWKMGCRIVRWGWDDVDKLHIQRWRTNKQRKWVPTGQDLFITLPDVKECFGEKGILKKVLLEYYGG